MNGMIIFAWTEQKYMVISQRFSWFLGLGLVLVLANLLVMNDVNTVFSGAESSAIWAVQQGETARYLPLLLLSVLFEQTGLQTFWLRLPGPILFLGALASVFLLGRKVFGKEASVLTIMVLGASLLMPNLAKWAVADPWELAFQVCAFYAMILFLKQPLLKWRLLFIGAALLALWINPVSTVIFLGLGSAGLFLLHPQGKRMIALNPWVVMLAGMGILFFIGCLSWFHPASVFGYGQLPFWKYQAAHLLGFLPFLGFVAGGIRELWTKFRKREELAIILVAWGGAAILAQSHMLAVWLAFMVAKQMVAYFAPGYPHRAVVKTGALLHLIAAFFLATFLMMKGYYEFGGVGFRAGLAFSGAYWIPVFLGVVGLYGMNRRYLWGGTILSGMLFTFFFWIQLGPLWESKRDWAPGITTAAQSSDERLHIVKGEGEKIPNLAVYGQLSFSEIHFVRDQTEAWKQYRSGEEGWYILDRQFMGSDTIASDRTSYPGWINGWQPVEMELRKSKRAD